MIVKFKKISKSQVYILSFRCLLEIIMRISKRIDPVYESFLYLLTVFHGTNVLICNSVKKIFKIRIVREFEDNSVHLFHIEWKWISLSDDNMHCFLMLLETISIASYLLWAIKMCMQRTIKIKWRYIVVKSKPNESKSE